MRWSLVLAALVALGCSSRARELPSQPRRVLPPPAYPSAHVAPPSGGWGPIVGALGLDQACPPPGLPPEIAARLDCAAMRKIAGATPYTPKTVAVATLPGAVDLRAWSLTGPIKDQKEVGSCAGFAMSSVLDNVARRHRRADIVAPLHLFSTYTGAGLEKVKGHPITLEVVWPYDPARACRFARTQEQASQCGARYGVVPGSAWADPQLLQERARADAFGTVRVDAFEELPTPMDFDQLAALIADGESPWVSLRFYRPAWESEDVRRTGYLPYYPPEAAREFHAVVLEGYRYGQWGREFLIRNSWGEAWGDGGRVWAPEKMLETHLAWGYRVRASLTSVPSDGSTPPLPMEFCIRDLGIPGLDCNEDPFEPAPFLGR